MSLLTQGHRAAVEAIESESEAMIADETTDAARTDEETTAAQGDTRTTPILPAATTESASARTDMVVVETGAMTEVDGRTDLLARTVVDPGHQEEVDVIEMAAMIDDETAVMSLAIAEVVVVVAEIAMTVEEETIGRRAHRHLPRSANLHPTLPMWSPSSIESAA